MKVLIADDSELIRNRLINMISKENKIEIVGQAKNAEETKKLTKELNPDVVILDIRLPDALGIEVLKDIKNRNASLKVIMFTNYPYPQYRKRCFEIGADYFFSKYDEFSLLYNTLKKISEK